MFVTLFLACAVFHVFGADLRTHLDQVLVRNTVNSTNDTLRHNLHGNETLGLKEKSEVLECYDGDAYDVEFLKVQKCPNSQFCIKLIDTDKFYQLRLCDPDNLCVNFGDKCATTDLKIEHPYFDGTPETLCCCKGNLCNGALRHYSLLTFAVIIVQSIVLLVK